MVAGTMAAVMGPMSSQSLTAAEDSPEAPPIRRLLRPVLILTRHSLTEIGGHPGGRDHATVMHAGSKIAEAKQADLRMQSLPAELTGQITPTI
jgi:hypothetical protein